jgi:hypothetical protein
MPIGTFLNGRAPTQLRGLQWLALSDTGKVGTRTPTSDAGGGASAVWTFGADVPCRIDPLGGSESVTGERLSERSTHVVTTPVGTVVSSSNRFSITNRGTFEITAVPIRTSELAHVFEVTQIT